MKSTFPSEVARYLPATLILLGAAFACWLVALVTANFVEKRSFSSISALLIREELDWAHVSVDGLNVMVSGVAPSEALRFRALSLAATVVDPARIDDTMSVSRGEVTIPRFSIEILRNDGEISLIGLVPKEPIPADYVASIAEATGALNITNLLQTANYQAPPGWLAAIDFSVEALRQLPRSKISVGAGQIVISALSDSEADRTKLITQLRRIAPKGMQVQLDIVAPRPAITPFTLRFVLPEGGKPRFDACSADTETSQSAILSVARAAGFEREPRCQIGLGAPSPRWGEASVAVMKAVLELGGGTVTISDTDVALQALPDVDAVLFETVVGKLDRTLPDIFTLTAERPVSDPAAPQAVAELVARKDAEGRVTMRGPTSSDRDQEIVDAVAKARFGAGGLNNLTRVGQGLPETWNLRVLAGLEALALLDNGEVVVKPDLVAVTGETGNQAMQDAVTRVLTGRLGEEARLDIAVSYIEKLDPLLALPTPLECVNRINAVLKETKIKFAPGAADIDAGSAQQLNDLAEAFKDCQDYKMEVAGHTDSQGRDEMNLQLSQARAEAVIDALMARRVLTAQLVAKGYGETVAIGDNETEEGREQNRRIEFRLLADGGRIVVSGAGEDTPPVTVGTDVPAEGGEGETVVDRFAVNPDLAPDVAPEAIPKPRPAGLEGPNE
jgi:OmpA-OmpF porin, OOP family